MARQLARGMGSFFKECGCSRPTRCPHPYTIRFRDALGKQREEAGYDTQDDVIERLTQIYAEKKTAAPAEKLIRPVQAACRYSWRMPPSRWRRRMSRWVICSGSLIGIGIGKGRSGRAWAIP